MAFDFIQLKRDLLGRNTKVFLIGGSHGAMLGAQIVRDYSDEIEKAALFSGDTESGWLAEGWFRFDAHLKKLDSVESGFTKNLVELLTRAGSGQLKVNINDNEVVVERSRLEAALWLAFSLSSAAQAALPNLVRTALDGDLDWVAAIYAAQSGLLAPGQIEAPPTDESVVINFHRCNVWFPKSSRASAPMRQAGFLRYDSFVSYWNALCEGYDELGEFPFEAKPKRRSTVPILSWVGDQDTFDPEGSRARWDALTSNLQFHVMPGWSHDFGTDGERGFQKVTGLLKTFFRPNEEN